MWELYQKLLKLPPSTFYYLEENSITPPSQVWNYQNNKKLDLKEMKVREPNFPWKENEPDTDAMFLSPLVTMSPIATFSPFLGSGSYLLFWNFPLNFFSKQNPQVEPTVLSKQWKQTWRYNMFWLDCQHCLNQAFFFERKSETISFVLYTSHYLP